MKSNDMPEATFVRQLDLIGLGQSLCTLGSVGMLREPAEPIRTLLVVTGIVEERTKKRRRASSVTLLATSHLYALAPSRSAIHAVRRLLSLLRAYREHLLDSLIVGLGSLPDDNALADTLEHLDHLSPELLARFKSAEGEAAKNWFARWDAEIWQAPDAVTLLAKVIEYPGDCPQCPNSPKVVVGFDWLSWDTPPATPAPAPWGDSDPLHAPLTTIRHPFWGALVATLDACTGDYEWQSLMLRGGVVRSQHRTLGNAETVLAALWERELGLYPAAPLVLPELISFAPGKPMPWLQPALEHMAEYGVATRAQGSWRLTDAFRTQLMQDDEHMLAFEAIRKRSYRLARAAAQTPRSTESGRPTRV
jgi:hypothetical protein